MPVIQISADKLIGFFGLPITNTLLMSWAVMFFLVTLSIYVFHNRKFIPSFLQNIFEFVIEESLKFVESVFDSREIAEKYYPIVMTIFIFILFSNWFGILPGIGSIGMIVLKAGKKEFIPFFRSAASDLNFTLALAIVAVVLSNVYGVLNLGFGKHISKFFSFKGPIKFFVGLLEIISEIAKMISFSFRLFGNVFAGEVLLVMTAFLIPYFVPVPFLALEIFVGFIQALVFAMLTMVFINIAITNH